MDSNVQPVLAARGPSGLPCWPMSQPAPGGAQAGWGGAAADPGMTAAELGGDRGREGPAVEPRLLDPAMSAPKALLQQGEGGEEDVGGSRHDGDLATADVLSFCEARRQPWRCSWVGRLCWVLGSRLKEAVMCC